MWPDVLKDLNIINNKSILKILNQSIEYLYNQCDYLLAQSPRIKKILHKKFKNTLLVYNPSNINRFQSKKKTKNKIKKIIFAGNIGKAQALEKLIGYGRFIKEKKLPILFEIIGEGSNKKNLQLIAKEANLEKIIIFKDFMKPEIIEKYLLNADGFLVSLGIGRALSSTIPAKFQTYVSYGKPIFAFSGNTVAEIIKRYNIGFVVNDINFKEKIHKFLNMNVTTSNIIRNNNKNIFNNVNFEIKYGDKIGIVGESGIGKTTLVNLISGLLEPTKGTILSDGIDVHKNIKSWQSNIGYIYQSTFLMNDTVENNISFNSKKDDLHYKKISKIIKLIKLNSLINKLPKGLNTIVGDDGAKLSGGQIQRIGIARALYFDRKLLICDEITNSLDNISENSVINSLKVIDKTIIIISHKIQNLNFCSKVYEIRKNKLFLVRKK